MTGHVVPWCLDCGLEEHDSSLFTYDGDPVLNDDLLDREVVIDREFGCSVFVSIRQVCELFGMSRPAFQAALRRGTFPPAAIPGDHTDMAMWRSAEVADIYLARNFPNRVGAPRKGVA